jgi:predicted AAA+ superfamily ATPase
LQGKIYFYDLGIRNSLINNFAHPDDRMDMGQLWENFLMMERQKNHHYKGTLVNRYFWRTYSGTEIDLVEEIDGKLMGYEFKWGNRKVRTPKSWTETYENAQFMVVNKDNYQSFIL